MMKTAMWLAALALAGCASAGEMEETAESRALQRQLAERVAGEPENCVPQSQLQSLQPVDPRTIVYETGREIWVNRLPADCRSLRPGTTLIVEAQGDRYCRNDRVRALEPGSTVPGPICRLGSFTPYRRR
jgi:hypothetical protein